MTRKEITTARKKPGGSNVGKYKGVKSFAGPSGGAPKGSYPINTLKRAKSALKLAHHAPNPAGIKAKVYRKYPQLKHAEGGIVRTPIDGLKCGGKKRDRRFAGGGVNWSSILSLLGNNTGSNNATTNTVPLVTGDKYFDSLRKSQQTSDQIASLAGNLKGVNVSRQASELMSQLIAGKPDEYGVKDKSDFAVGLAGFTDIRGAATGALNDFQNKKFTIKTLASILAPGVRSVMDNYDNKRERERLKLQPAQQRSIVSQLSSGYKSGGKIKGAGGPKSDQIEKKVEDGSFIVPAENAELAMDLGKKYLNWQGGETADRKYPGTEIKVSNGEVMFTPEEVDILKYHGLDLNRLAPNAEPENKMKEGGMKKELTGIKKKEDFVSAYLNEYPGTSEEDATSAWEGLNQPEKTPETKDTRTKFQKLLDFAPELAGAIQVGAAARGFQKAGEMPDINVASALRSLVTESHKEAEYGLEPGTKAAMLNQVEKARRDATNAIVGRGGSSAEIMSNLQGILGTTIDKKFGIELNDSAEKIRKKGTYYNLKSKVADQQFDISKLARQDWLQMQEVNAGLLSAGISNIIGARKLKMEMDTMKKVGRSTTDWSAIT